MSGRWVTDEWLRHVCAHTKHGPSGKGGAGPCADDCVKCEAERLIAAPAVLIDKEIDQLRNLLDALKETDAHPERGPYYLHDLINPETALIKFLELHLPAVP